MPHRKARPKTQQVTSSEEERKLSRCEGKKTQALGITARTPFLLPPALSTTACPRTAAPILPSCASAAPAWILQCPHVPILQKSSPWGPSNVLVLMLTPINSMVRALLGYKYSGDRIGSQSCCAGGVDVRGCIDVHFAGTRKLALPVQRAAELWACCVNQEPPSCL